MHSLLLNERRIAFLVLLIELWLVGTVVVQKATYFDDSDSCAVSQVSSVTLEDGQKIEVAAPRKLNIAVYVWDVDQLHLFISSLDHLREPFYHGVLSHLPAINNPVHELDQ